MKEYKLFCKVADMKMSSTLNICPTYTKPPSYIREVLKSTDHIYLIHNKNNKTRINSDENTIKLETVLEESSASLDLTGNPLQIDLSCDVSFMALEEHTWFHEENNHYPLTLTNARKIIDKFNRESTDKRNPLYVYGVCDGMDKNCTLILGAYQSEDVLSRTEIYSRGCFNQNDSRISLDNMKHEHFHNTNSLYPQVNTIINATYTIFGNNLRHYKISGALPYNACILYNVSWNTYQYDVPEYVQSAEMTLQTIIGHTDSQMYLFWKQFMLLRIYIKILVAQPADFEKVILSDEPKNYLDISDEVCALLKEVQGVRKTISRKKLNNLLDVKNLHQENFADKLWTTLICCNNVGDLKSCFHILFEELAMKESFKPIIPDNNKSSIACIINEISRGKLAVPTLTPTQALECLIELGVEKLKNDYFYILNHYDCLNSELLENYWSTTGEYTPDVKCEFSTKGSLEKVSTRRVRLTVQPTTSLIGAAERLAKMNCLLKMHIACEFLILGEQAKLSTQESFDALVESVNAYVLKLDNTVLPKNLSDYMLQEINVNLQSNDVKFLQGKDPNVWNVRLTSSYDRSMITTIFHHSQKPLFPPCIYNKYDIPFKDGDLGDSVYYVSKLVNWTEKL